MRSGMPGQNDRLIGRNDTGGQGGGTILCPIFDSQHPDDSDCSNFYSPDTDTYLGSFSVNPYETAGVVTVLFIPGLFHYSLETHYGDDELDFTGRNWENLLSRLNITNKLNRKKVEQAVKGVLAQVLLPPGQPKPDARETMLSVTSTMLNQVVPVESRSEVAQPPGRTSRKLGTLKAKRLARARLLGTPEDRQTELRGQ